MSLVYNIIKLNNDVKERFNEFIKSEDLTVNQWLVLKTINISPEQRLTASEIVDSLDSDKATISQILKILEKKKYIVRLENTRDRRSRTIELTDEVREKCKRLIGMEEKFSKEFMKKLSLEEQDVLNGLIEILIS